MVFVIGLHQLRIKSRETTQGPVAAASALAGWPANRVLAQFKLCTKAQLP